MVESERSRGITLMIASTALFAVMGTLVKVAGAEASPAQCVFWRNAFSVLAMVPLIVRNPTVVVPHARGTLVWRALTGVASMFCYFTAIHRLRLGDAVMISYASPLVVAAIAPWFGDPRPDGGLWRALGAGFLGVALVADPSFAGDAVGVAAAVATAVLAGFAYVFVRLAAKTDGSDTIVLWFCAIAAMVFAPVLALEPMPRHPVTWLALLGTGIVGMVAQQLMTRAYRFADATTVSLFGYLTPVFAYFLGALVWGQVPGWRGMAGTALVALAGWMATRQPRG